MDNPLELTTESLQRFVGKHINELHLRPPYWLDTDPTRIRRAIAYTHRVNVELDETRHIKRIYIG